MYFGNPTTLSRQKILSPRLDLSIQTLKGARDNVKLLKFHDGEGLAATDEEGSQARSLSSEGSD